MEIEIQLEFGTYMRRPAPLGACQITLENWLGVAEWSGYEKEVIRNSVGDWIIEESNGNVTIVGQKAFARDYIPIQIVEGPPPNVHSH